MARGINKVILVGNLGSDPEVRYTPQGTAVANFNLATNEAYKDKEGQLQEKTEWHRIVVWDRLAEICEKYLKKGSQIYIEGSLQTRQYEDKEGVTKYTTEIKAREMQILGSRDGSNEGGRSDVEYDERPARSGGGQSRESRGGYSGGGGSRSGGSGGYSGGGARSGGRSDDGGSRGPWDDGGSRGGARSGGAPARSGGRTVEPDSSFDPAGDDDLPF